MNQQNTPSTFKSKAGFRRVPQAFKYSLAGLRAAWQHEHAFRQELVLMAILWVIALLTSTTRVEKALLIGSTLLVLVVELVNSAIEAVVDRISLEQHPLAGRAKDIGSAAVLVSLLNVGVVWCLVLWP